MSALLVIIGIISGLSFMFSIYAVYQAFLFERLRIHARDNEDRIANISAQLNRSRRSHEARLLKLEKQAKSQSAPNDLVQALHALAGDNDREDDAYEYDEDGAIDE